MFAVPGWSVSASSLVQQQVKSKKEATQQDSNSLGGQSKKRKRSSEDTSRQSRNKLSDTACISTGVKDITENPSSPRETLNASKQANSPTGVSSISIDNRRSRARSIENQENVQARNNRPGVLETAQKPSKARLEPGNLSKRKEDGLHTKHNGHTAAAKTSPFSQAETALTPLQAKMRHKLTSARFRHLNETLYTTSSSDALQLFTASPELFADYHSGFAQQVKDSWPQNPVEEYIKTIKTRGRLSYSANGSVPLPRRKTESCTIADLGCGDAPLARGCQAVTKSLKLKFHNYDLHAPNSLVTKADIADLPLRDGEADVAVFCLSLMGINWISFVEEAWRILRGDGKGEVWVAEVKSRFGRVTKGRVVENSVGKRQKKPKSKKIADDEDGNGNGPEALVEDEASIDDAEDATDVSAFVKVFTRRGFQLREGSLNKRNKMFVSMIFTKTGIPTAGKHRGLKWTGKEYQRQQDGKMRFAGGQREDDEVTPEQEAKVLKPCVYKIR